MWLTSDLKGCIARYQRAMLLFVSFILCHVKALWLVSRINFQETEVCTLISQPTLEKEIWIRQNATVFALICNDQHESVTRFVLLHGPTMSMPRRSKGVLMTGRDWRRTLAGNLADVYWHWGQLLQKRATSLHKPGQWNQQPMRPKVLCFPSWPAHGIE